MNIKNKLILICFFISSAYAETNQYSDGKLAIKFMVTGTFENSKPDTFDHNITGIPAAADQLHVDKVLEKGIGFMSSVQSFVNDNLASDISLGFLMYRITQLENIQNNYYQVNKKPNNAFPALGKNNQLYAFPLSLGFQYHLAPFGPISPYLGASFQYSFMFSRAKGVKINNIASFGISAGVNFVTKNDMIFFAEVKKLFNKKVKVTFTDPITSGSDSVSTHLKMDPIFLSIGIGYKL